MFPKIHVSLLTENDVILMFPKIHVSLLTENDVICIWSIVNLSQLWHLLIAKRIETNQKTYQKLYILFEIFGQSNKKQYLCTTRTRQASQRCSNVRVVLFLYNEQQNPIPQAVHQCARFG